MARDKVQLHANERLDLNDARALQDNTRSDARAAMMALLSGDSSRTLVISGFTVTEDPSGPSALIRVTRGRALGQELLLDGSRETGVLFGAEGEDTQDYSFSGKPNGSYTVYVRFNHETGAPGTRIFWDAAAEQETAQTKDTRWLATWDVEAATSSPGDEWIPIADVSWGGATIVTIVHIVQRRLFFFEGDEGAGYAPTWGDGANDRNIDRGTYGVKSLYVWVQAVMRQFADILGDGWFTETPVALDDVKAHMDDTTDPHGASPSFSGTVTVGNGVAVTGDSTFNDGVDLAERPTLASVQYVIYAAHDEFTWEPSGASPVQLYTKGGGAGQYYNTLRYSGSGTSDDFVINLSKLAPRGVAWTLDVFELEWFHEHSDVDGQVIWSLEKRAPEAAGGLYTVIASGTRNPVSGANTTAPKLDDFGLSAAAITADQTCRMRLRCVNKTNDKPLIAGARVSLTPSSL